MSENGSRSMSGVISLPIYVPDCENKRVDYYYWTYSQMNWDNWNNKELFRVMNGKEEKIFPSDDKSCMWAPGSLSCIHNQGGFILYNRIFDAKASLVSVSTEFRKNLDDFDNIVGSDIHKITVDETVVYSGETDDSKRNSDYLLSELNLNKVVTMYSPGFRCVVEDIGSKKLNPAHFLKEGKGFDYIPYRYKIYFIEEYITCLSESEYNENVERWITNSS